MNSIRVAHLVETFGRANSPFIHRTLSNSDVNVFNAVWCTKRVGKRSETMDNIYCQSTAKTLRRFLSRRVSGRFANWVDDKQAKFRWRRFLADHRINILHAQDGKESLKWRSLFESTDLPLIVTFHGSDINRATFASKYLDELRWLFKRCSACHFVSDTLRHRAIELGASDSKSTTIYLGTPILKKKEYSERTKNCVFGIIANLGPCKGHETLINAFELTIKRCPQSVLHIWGDGPLRDRLEWVAIHSPAKGKIQFHGMMDNAKLQQECIPGCDVVIQPSQRDDGGSEEGLPISLCEAAAIGVPCIGTACGGIPEIVLDRETGILVRQRDVESLANAMIELAESPQLRKTLGERARANAMQNFDVDNQLAKITKLYARHAKDNV